MLDKNLELKEEDLEQVNGGAARRVRSSASKGELAQTMPITCCKCHKTITADLSKSVAICSFCGHENFMMG